LFLAIVGGVAYIYFSGRQAAKIPTPEVVVTKEKPPISDPVKPAANAPESAAVQFLDSPVKAGNNTSITVTTGPDSACTIAVAYGKVISHDSGLSPKTADVHGSVTWSWTVDSTVAPGKYTVKVTCVRNNKTGYVEGYLEVTK